MLVYFRLGTNTSEHTYTVAPHGANLESLGNLECMLLDYGWKLEHMEETHTNTELHTEIVLLYPQVL